MSINKDSFRALPIKERAALINKYVSGGMMDLGEMRRHYNSFDTGGDTDGDGNIVLDWIRKQLYDKIDPVGYNKFVDRVKAAILGKGEDRYNKARDDIFATYLKIPKDERHNVEEAKKVSDATYTPTKSSEDSTYHKIELTDKEKDALIYDALRSNANVGDNSRSHVFEQFFGPHQVGRGKDEKGEYVSYYDLWDLDPSSGESKTGDFEFLKSLQELLGAKDMSLGVGEPVEFYDRIYLNDYYGVTPQVDEGDIEGGYLPLAYVEASAGTGSAGQLTGEDYYDAGENSLPTYSKGGKLNSFGGGGDTNSNDSKKTSNNKEALKAKIDKTLFFTIAKQFGFTPKQLQDLAYLFGSDAAVSKKGYAGIEDILRILSPGYKPTNPMDDNKRMFLYGNVNGLPPAENTNGKDFSEYIDATYPGANIKSYQGVINPFDEYVIDVRDKGLLEELAAKGENLYVDADVEYGGQQHNYRDDVASYAFKPVVGNNGLMISAADLYDFGPDYNPAKYDPNASKTDSLLGKLESKLFGFVGNPYILRQDNIPIRFIDYNNASKEDISKAEDLKYAIKNGMMSAKEFDDGTDLDKKLAEVLGNEFLEPITVIAEAKKANGGKLNMFDMGGDTDGDEEPIYMGELDEAVVKPAPVKAELNTYYPITSKFPFTGHSELIIHDNKPFHSPTIITSGGYHPDYNLVTNNCSDATRRAIEQIYGEKIDPFLFTTPGDVRDFLLEKGVDIYETDKGKDSQFFEIPFATAMDLKNKSIDDTIYRLVMWAEEQRERLQENPNWDSISFDAAMHDTYRSLENEKYKFQPFVDGYEIDENGNYIKASGGRVNRFDIGGNTNTPNKTKEQIAVELQSKNRNELISLQQTLADAGYYDQTLQLGKSGLAFELQDFLINKGLLTENDRDGSIGEDTLKALQTFLVNEKYLPRYTETGSDNIDGKLGNTTQSAYNAYLRKSNVDGFYGDKTLNAYYNYLNQNDNTVHPTNTSDLTEEEFFKYINTPIRQKTWQSDNFKGWSDDDLRYLHSKLATTGWDPRALMYAIDRETNFMPYAKNPSTSAIGLAQLTKDQLKQLYKDSYKDLSEEELTDKVNKVYNSYRDKTRSIKDIIDDTILQYTWMRNRIKTEPYNMGYGRIKVNLLAPNASLDSKVPKYVYEGSLTKAQQAKIKLGEATYRDLMKMYDEEFKNKFNLQ